MEYKILSFPLSMLFGNTENTVYPTLLWDNRNIILVDCGFVGSLPQIEKELGRHGLSVEQITGLVLTHHDHDHMGSAAEIKRINPHLKIYASAVEAPYISAHEKPLRLRQAEEMQEILPPEQQDFGKAFCEMLRRVEPVQVDVFLRDEELMDWCGGCRIIATPGHTPGHISLLMEKESIVITGDAFVLEDGKPAIANPQFTLDIEQATESMEKLLSLKAKAYYCYHGGLLV
ncbi:MBL fold metallo-hydrolase [Acetivibrio straminisolvens]|jgi:glyoxylase-like metal-dependent hydrolase (beta-lactamase superfamily II)|uniref:MBL fold metallo-hydrolase n=1 Tax=Acetivibrio straminisolvens TaxID=253314 RepID=UPI00223F8FD0|nr:MBL fold metallo-hydrolase [Acetivibrio straminisolvens]